ncbi:MAG: hypothetical protein KC442_19950 [Thermomicrobiales bacterium]|nr:hypothetical protein [Thermomicrobiales bacterium]
MVPGWSERERHGQRATRQDWLGQSQRLGNPRASPKWPVGLATRVMAALRASWPPLAGRWPWRPRQMRAWVRRVAAIAHETTYGG